MNLLKPLVILITSVSSAVLVYLLYFTTMTLAETSVFMAMFDAVAYVVAISLLLVVHLLAIISLRWYYNDELEDSSPLWYNLNLWLGASYLLFLFVPAIVALFNEIPNTDYVIPMVVYYVAYGVIFFANIGVNLYSILKLKYNSLEVLNITISFVLLVASVALLFLHYAGLNA